MRLKLFCLLLAFSIGTALAQKDEPQKTQPEKMTSDSTTREPVVEKFSVSGEPVATPQMAGGYFGPTRCREGDVFIRPIRPKLRLMNTPLVRLSADGTSLVQFDPNVVPELFGIEFLAPVYAVDSLGRAYFFVRLRTSFNAQEDRSLIVAFAADGTYFWKVQLDRNLWPYSLTVLPSGDFLISGSDRAPYEEQAQSAKSFTGVFGKDGRLRRSFKLVADNPTPAQGDAADARRTAEPRSGSPTLQFGDAVVGPDGYVYLFDPISGLKVKVLSETGEVIRELTLKPPLKGAQILGLMVGDWAIAVRFLGPNTGESKVRPHVWGIYDSTSGEPMRYYDANSVKGFLACFDREHLTFVVPKNNRMALLRVAVH